MLQSPPETEASRELLVDSRTRMKPKTVARLNDWQYLERTVHRLLAAWGGRFAEWEDKSALHRQIWDQAQVIDRLRNRIAEFPGGDPDAPVSHLLEHTGNVILMAPGLEDAIDGIYDLLMRALVRSYAHYVQTAHPVHDAPTLALLREINTVREQHFLWYRDYRRRRPHTTSAGYRDAVRQAIEQCGGFHEALAVEKPARPVGLATDYRPVAVSARPPGSDRRAQEFMPYVKADFSASVEARRLFWAVGYLNEKNLPDDQLRWIYYGHFMPWGFQHDVSRHLWDESRHGDSGLSRLKDFGVALEEIGFPPYKSTTGADGVPIIPGETAGVSMPPKELYEEVFHIGMVAETGHFIVKNESYADFKEIADYESAEMMLFDIIDETAHVQYAHRWLPVLAEQAGIDNANYKQKAVEVRAQLQAEALRQVGEYQKLPRHAGVPAWDQYQELLARIRARCGAPHSDQHLDGRAPLPM